MQHRWKRRRAPARNPVSRSSGNQPYDRLLIRWQCCDHSPTGTKKSGDTLLICTIPDSRSFMRRGISKVSPDLSPDFRARNTGGPGSPGYHRLSVFAAPGWHQGPLCVCPVACAAGTGTSGSIQPATRAISTASWNRAQADFVTRPISHCSLLHESGFSGTAISATQRSATDNDTVRMRCREYARMPDFQ